MTICLAAICTTDDGKEAIIGASDCMLTYQSSGQSIEFEPPQSKMLNLNNKTFILFAGDITEHTTIWRNAFGAKTTDGIPIAEIAERYAFAYQERRLKIAEAKYLRPQGLTRKTYVTNQTKLLDYTVNELRPKMEDSRLELEVIIAGLDKSGAHLFTIEDPGVHRCHDDLSFCAVGTGAFLACSSYMFSRYTKVLDYAYCAYTTYWGKRRAELAPGVGRETMMVEVTEANGARILKESFVRMIKNHYEYGADEVGKIIDGVRERIRDQLHHYVS
jgi:hypothetical protein